MRCLITLFLYLLSVFLNSPYIASSNSSANSSGLAQLSMTFPSTRKAAINSSLHFNLTASVVVGAGKVACFLWRSLFGFSSFTLTSAASVVSFSFFWSFSSFPLSDFSSFFFELLDEVESFSLDPKHYIYTSYKLCFLITLFLTYVLNSIICYNYTHIPDKNFFQFLIRVFDKEITSSSLLDFLKAFTVIPMRVLVKSSKLTGNFWSILSNSKACSWPWLTKRLYCAYLNTSYLNTLILCGIYMYILNISIY